MKKTSELNYSVTVEHLVVLDKIALTHQKLYNTFLNEETQHAIIFPKPQISLEQILLYP